MRRVCILFLLVVSIVIIGYDFSVPTFAAQDDKLILLNGKDIQYVVSQNVVLWKSKKDSGLIKIPSTYPFGVIVYGDSRYGDDVHKKLVEQMLKLDFSIVIHLGDMVNKGDNLEDWYKFFQITELLRKKVLFQPVRGNHELPDKFYKEYLKIYNNRFTILDYNFIFIDPLAGLDEAIDYVKNNLKDKILVFSHYPIVTVGHHVNDTISKRLFSGIFPLTMDNKILMYVGAHDHNYQRFVFDKFVQIITAGGGASLYSQQLAHKNLVVFKKEYHFVYLKFFRDRIEGQAINQDGKVIDEFILAVKD